MEMVGQFVDYFLHLDVQRLNALADVLGPWLYVVLFLVIFCETGLVVTPILPGDSFLFAVGAFAAIRSPFTLLLCIVLLIVAAVLGDAVNYYVGFVVGPKVFKSEHSRLLNHKHLVRTQQFYEKYGGKTIVLARFIPIIRTFAPFVAGIGKMQYPRFAFYNIAGGSAWVLLFLLLGFFLGSLEPVQTHLSYIALAIIFISVLPIFIEFILSRRRRAAAASQI
jgi:membrane-associated protein